MFVDLQKLRDVASSALELFLSQEYMASIKKEKRIKIPL